MKNTIILLIVYIAIIKSEFKSNSREYPNWKSNGQGLTNATQIISMRCQSNKIDIIYFNANDLKFPKLCSYQRTYSQKLIYSLILRTGEQPQPLPLTIRKMYINETRTNGSLNIVSIGFIESGIKQLIGSSFVEIIRYPNLKRDSCNYVEGITRQVGTAHFILANLKSEHLAKLFFSYNPAQLVTIFKKHEIAQCFANSRLRYRTAVRTKNLIYLTPPDMSEKRETYVENLAECEPMLSESVVRITDKQEIRIRDSCDSVNLSDRYESGITRFVVYETKNKLNNVSVKIIYKNGNRFKGSFNETTLGFVVKGPQYLLGMAYMRLVVIPNVNPIQCRSESGVTKLIGSAERIFAALNVQNLMSIMTIDSLISKIRMNRVIDCLGFISVSYEPGLTDYIEKEKGYLSNLTETYKYEKY